MWGQSGRKPKAMYDLIVKGMLPSPTYLQKVCVQAMAVGSTIRFPLCGNYGVKSTVKAPDDEPVRDPPVKVHVPEGADHHALKLPHEGVLLLRVHPRPHPRRQLRLGLRALATRRRRAARARGPGLRWHLVDGAS